MRSSATGKCARAGCRITSYNVCYTKLLRTALRLVLHLLRQPSHQTLDLAEALTKLRQEIRFCKNCYNISDSEVCEICANPHRNEEIVCVVEDIRDVMAIENTSSFKGLYHVLGGKISPMDGIGPNRNNFV